MLDNINTQKAIQVKIFNVFGEPGSGKTMLFAFISYYYWKQGGEVWSNFEIKINWKKINKQINKVSDISKIKKKDIKGLLILDEAGDLLNSRESMTNIKDKKEILELAFLSRKKNIDIGLGAQLDYTIDKYFRDLAKYNLYMQSMRITMEDLIFSYKIFTRGGQTNWFLIWEKEIKTLRAIKLLKVEYNTLDESRVQNDRKKEKKERKKTEKLKSIELAELF